MTIPTGQLHLASTQQRRVGLTRSGYTHVPLLQSLNTANASKGNSSGQMAPKTATKRVKAEVEILPVKEDSDEDITRLPDSSSDEGEDPSDIKGTNFVRGSSRLEEPVPESKPSPSSKKPAGTNGGTKKGNAVGIERGTRSRNVVPTSSTSSVGSAGSTKRKGEDQTLLLGEGQKDVFGDVRRGKKVKTKYGSKPEVRILVSKKKQKGFTIECFPL